MGDAGADRNQSEEPGAKDIEDGLKLETASAKGNVRLQGTRFRNVGVVVIEVTESNVKDALREFAGDLNRDALVGRFGIFLAFGIVLLTVDFKTSRFGIPANVLQIGFITLTACSFIWLLFAVVHYLTRGGQDKAIDRCISSLKGSDDGVEFVDS
jgi:hypothetical protein